MWLERAGTTHQGAGLQRLSAQTGAGPRLLPVLATPDSHLELETLWQLCSQLQQLGYAVMVLDASAREGAHAPGLAQVLQTHSLPLQATLDASAADAALLPVLPAALGLRRLAQQGGGAAALRRLITPFRAYGALLLYAPPALAAPLLQGSACTPLALTGAGAQGMVACYLQLKHMALHAGLRCTVAAMTGAEDARRTAQTREALQALARSASQMLGLAPHTTQIRADQPRELRRLALQLLEGGCANTTTAHHNDYDHPCIDHSH